MTVRTQGDPMGTSVLERLSGELGASDLLVLERTAGHLAIAGGWGRGVGWAGIAATPLDDEPHAQAATQGRVVRIGGGEPQRIVGPYWARTAILVPVGDSHVVAFGGNSLVRVSDGELLRHAAEAVAACGSVPADRLLADELELVHAIRTLMAHRPETVAETARHVASVAAEALACELGVVLLQRESGPMVVVAGDAACDCPNDEALARELLRLAERTGAEPLIEQEGDAELGIGGVDLVSRLSLRIGVDGLLGTLMVGHTRDRPRGFTMLCQRIARSIADASEGLISQAILREELAADRDRFANAARTDPLTGLGNRIAWDEALLAASGVGERPIAILVADIDGLKRTNDARGHAAGDELVVAAAEALRSAVRAGDTIARLGGDEFGVLLHGANEEIAAVVADRISHACGPALRVSMGWAEPKGRETLQQTQGRADERMRTDKRRRRIRAAG